MKYPWRIETIKLESGESYPLMLSREDGLPLFKPTVYATSMIRNKGKAESTTETNLNAIMFLYSWGMKHGINIEERFRKGDFLKLHEIENLSDEVRVLYSKLYDYGDIPNSIFGKKKPAKPRRKKRMNAIKPKKASNDFCDSHTASIRFRYIRDYLDWLASQRMARVSEISPEYHSLDLARKNMQKEINARMPDVVRGGVKDPVFERLGLTREVQDILEEVIKPESPRNPFKHKHAKIRNRLIVLLMLRTGIRRGEALGIRNTDGDLDLQKNNLTRYTEEETPNKNQS